MNSCLGERIDPANWGGLPMGRFRPLSGGSALPVAAAQDTLFVWKDGASAAQVRSRNTCVHHQRHAGVFDFMAKDEEAIITHDSPHAVGECVLVAIPAELRSAFDDRFTRQRWLLSRFGLKDPFVHESVRVLEQACSSKLPSDRLLVESISTALLTYFLSRYADDKTVDAKLSRGGPGRLPSHHQTRIIRFVEDHLGDNVGLVEMAGLVGRSPAQFIRLFTRTFAQTPHQFVLARRIDRAKWLLQADRDSLAEVSASCGFASPSHFSAAFRKHTGVTPGQFRMAQGRRSPVQDNASGVRNVGMGDVENRASGIDD